MSPSMLAFVALGNSITLRDLREMATGQPDGPARHPATGRFVSRAPAERLTPTEAAWFRSRSR